MPAHYVEQLLGRWPGADAIADYDEAPDPLATGACRRTTLRPTTIEALRSRNCWPLRGCHPSADYDEAIRLQPDYPEAYYNRGNAKSKLGRLEDAIADYDEATRRRPDFPEAYKNRGAATETGTRPFGRCHCRLR